MSKHLRQRPDMVRDKGRGKRGRERVIERELARRERSKGGGEGEEERGGIETRENKRQNEEKEGERTE